MTYPALTLQQIANYCGKETYLMGIEYENSEALSFKYKDDTTLLAICEGVQSPRYVTKVIYSGNTIEQSSCTCNYNRCLPCKHIAALLVTWFYYPQTFIAKEQWDITLAQYDKEQLVHLLGKMLDMHIGQEQPICQA